MIDARISCDIVFFIEPWVLKSCIMNAVADQVAETSSSDQSQDPPKNANGAPEKEPTTKLLYLHVYIDAHTKDRRCCNCMEKLVLKGIRYYCQNCHDASLCEECANSDEYPGNHTSNDQKIDLRRMIRIRASLKQFKYSFTEDDLASLEPTEENKRYLTHLVHQLGLREDFCLGCLDITPGNVHKDWLSHHRLRVSDLKDAAEAGCGTCSIAYRGLLTAATGVIKGSEKLRWNIRKEQIEVVAQLDERRRYLFRANPGHIKPWDTLRYAPLQTTSLGSEESFATIRSWIKACEIDHPHEQCARQGDALLPRRLIYIDPHSVSSDQEPVLSLQEPSAGTFGKYIALSHCWGMDPVFSTTRGNFSQLCTRINFLDLPLTFCDAVRCAQELGISHVWIDSLCIIQDDLLDWEVESAKMTSIYHDAYLVIAAGSSTSAEGGLLYERPDVIRGRPLESKEGSGVLDLLVQDEVPHAHGLFPSAMVRSPISTRAWCMQEQILARRSVSFFKEELIWECHSCLDCECGKITSSSPTSDMANLDSYDMTTLWLGSQNALFGDSFTITYKRKPYSFFPGMESILNEWRHLTVPAYTAKKLSKPKDRLPAAAGIASLIAKRYDQDYLAGIWRDDLKYGLMWSVAPSQAPAPAPEEYIAPSFSWASVNREVRYKCPVPTIHERGSQNGGAQKERRSVYGDIECELVEANVEPDGANPLGYVKLGSYIRLKGLSIQFTLRYKDGKYSLTHREEAGDERPTGSSFVFHPDCALKVNLQPAGSPSQGCIESVNRSKTAPDRGISDDFKAEVDALVLADVRELDGKWFSDCCAFIVLSPSQAHRDSYERLGLGTWRFGDDENDGQWVKRTECREFKII